MITLQSKLLPNRDSIIFSNKSIFMFFININKKDEDVTRWSGT